MLWFLLLFITNAGATIVPEEIPSLLSVVYSNIPPIKKGTDSRVGFGFALGPHADFQVMFELGPQKDTQQSPMPFPNAVKRVNERQTQKGQTKRKVTSSNNKEGNEFINSWSQRFKQKTKSPKPYQPLPIPDDNTKDSVPAGTVDLKKIIQTMGLTQGKINQPRPSIAPNALNKLKVLYGQKDDSSSTLGTISTTDRPRFVLKKNRTTKPPTAVLPTLNPLSSFDRLAQFNVNEEKATAVKKRKITEDLSDVSLDDE